LETNETVTRGLTPRDLMEVLVRIALIGLLVTLCFRVFAPFMNLMLWALILAIGLYPLQRGLARRLGDRHGRAATLLVVSGLLLMGVPTAMLGSSFASHVHDAYTAFENNQIEIKPPAPEVAKWPVIGKRVYSAWGSAAGDLPAYLKANKAQLEELARWGLSAAVNTAGSVVLFMGSLIVAGIIMAFGESGSHASRRILVSLVGPERGPRLQRLTTATIRSVATGVIGVAFIQALLLGIGFIAAGVPAAGVLAVVVMLIGILQLPALLVSLPVIAYLWWSGDSSTTANIAYTVYLLLAGAADNVLKPMLLGRGVDVPMPVILIGALGGMATGGIVGLFAGAVLLAVGYRVFMEWVDANQPVPDAQTGPTQVADTAPTGGDRSS